MKSSILNRYYSVRHPYYSLVFHYIIRLKNSFSLFTAWDKLRSRGEAVRWQGQELQEIQFVLLQALQHWRLCHHCCTCLRCSNSVSLGFPLSSCSASPYLLEPECFCPIKAIWLHLDLKNQTYLSVILWYTCYVCKYIDTKISDQTQGVLGFW